MTEFVNTLNDLGKCKFNDVNKSPFVSGTSLIDKTFISVRKIPCPFNPKTEESSYGIPAHLTEIRIGKDYRGSLKLPEGTETIWIWDIYDKRQVIEYRHRSEKGKVPHGKYFVYPYVNLVANEFRSADNRVKIKDIIPTEKRQID